MAHAPGMQVIEFTKQNKTKKNIAVKQFPSPQDGELLYYSMKGLGRKHIRACELAPLYRRFGRRFCCRRKISPNSSLAHSSLPTVGAGENTKSLG
jgi:hypothetical protein